MTSTRHRIVAGLLATSMLASALALAPAAHAQPIPNAQPPYNTDMTAMIPKSSRNAGTFFGASQSAIDKTGVTCRLHQNLSNSSSGTPSTTFGIQTWDAVAQTWLQAAVSGAVTTAADSDLYVYPGAVATSVPSNTAIFGIPITRTWRPFMILAGSGAPSINSQVECGYQR